MTALVLAVALLLAVCDSGHATGIVGHPLDPLRENEYNAVVDALTEAGNVDSTALYPLVTLQEPTKEAVLAWENGEPVQRLAFAIVKQGPETFEAVVDTLARDVVSWRRVDDVQAGLLPSVEYARAQAIVKASQEWQAGVRARGVEDLQGVVCIPNTAGYFGVSDEEENRRLVKVVCYAPGDADNFWGRPIEGLVALVDLNSRELVELIDTGAVPIPDGHVDLPAAGIGASGDAGHRVSLVQEGGPSFEVDGHKVNWQGWQFHFRTDPRLGTVVSLVRYDDGGDLRSILYQGSLSEIFIPYQDPDVGWFFRTYLDAGENSVGRLAVPLLAGLDCPDNAVYFGAEFADDSGRPYTQPNVACLYERYTGDIAWRHYESITGANNAQPATDLVLRSISAIGNYDYVFDWIFRQNGTIRVAVGATGVPQVKAVGDAAERESADTAYGHLVAEHTVATNHDHFFSFRLDLDVDGTNNSFVTDRLETELVDTPEGRESVWVVESSTAASESEAKLLIDVQQPALWRIINPNVTGPQGNPVSYHLESRTNAVSLLSDDDPPQRRAGFTNYHLWVTPYSPDEIYAAGVYPNQSRGGDGLPTWTDANRSIKNTDLVVWYTVGFHHAPRTEDWPVTPTVWNDFDLRPFDFFDRNPALDVPGGR